MPLRLDVTRVLTTRSDRVKAVDLHPTEPWMLTALYSGKVVVRNYETEAEERNLEISDLPVRCAKFVPRKNWIVAGSDDMNVTVVNYNTHERVKAFEAHTDYIRSIAVHPTLSVILTSSDDMLIKLWDWDKGFANIQVFEGHTHYVMQIAFNPKDTQTFASASLDKSVKVWSLGSGEANYTLEGHERGVNCVSYYQGGEKPYLVTGADDKTVRVFDYQTKNNVQMLKGHSHNISAVAFHPTLPIIITGSEDGTIRLWHSATYRLENTMNYGLGRVWSLALLPNSNAVAIGFDDGSIVIKLGREEPAVSMDQTGKVVWSRASEIQAVNVMTSSAEPMDGEPIQLAVKDLGASEVYPSTLVHSPSGRFVTVCGDGEYIIYTARAWRNKSFGSGVQFAWSSEGDDYAVRESLSKIKIFKKFKEAGAFKPPFHAESLFGGALIGVSSKISSEKTAYICFYDWNTSQFIFRIDVADEEIRDVFWSPSGELVVLACKECFYTLRFNADAVDDWIASGQADDDGFDESFEFLGETAEVVETGLWVGDCFLYMNNIQRLCYSVGGETVVVAHCDRRMYILNYLAKKSRVYLVDKNMRVTSYEVLQSVLEYQTAVIRENFEAAMAILPHIPESHRNRIAKFLEAQGFKEVALQVSLDPEHKFDLAIALGKLGDAYAILLEDESASKWRQLGDLALRSWNVELARECLAKAEDLGGLLLLYTSTGSADGMAELAGMAQEQGHHNIAFVAHFLLQDVEACIEVLLATKRIPEAAFFARTYCPSQVSRIVTLWKMDLSTKNERAAEALADPLEYTNLFPDLELALKAEQMMAAARATASDRPSAAYPGIADELKRDLLAEAREWTSGAAPPTQTEAPEAVAPAAPVVDDAAVSEDVVEDAAEAPVDAPVAAVESDGGDAGEAVDDGPVDVDPVGSDAGDADASVDEPAAVSDEVAAATEPEVETEPVSEDGDEEVGAGDDADDGDDVDDADNADADADNADADADNADADDGGDDDESGDDEGWGDDGGWGDDDDGEGDGSEDAFPMLDDDV